MKTENSIMHNGFMINLNQFRVKSNLVYRGKKSLTDSKKFDNMGMMVSGLIDNLDRKGGNLGLNQNSKIKSLAKTLTKLSKIGIKDSELLTEKLLDMYNWLTFENAKILSEKIIKLGKLSNSDTKCLDLPAGWSCPKADLCLSKVDKFSGETKNCGKFKCYATKAESQYFIVRAFRWHNYDRLRESNLNEMVEKLENAINQIKVLRLHASGDIFNNTYWEALKIVAKNNPQKIIFGYTKILAYVNDPDKPDNIYLNYSVGGKDDGKLENSDQNTPLSIVELEYTESAVCKNHNDIESSEDFFKILLGENVHLNLH